MRLFFATDIHGSDICFRKFLKAAKFYSADALFLGGDYTNKSLVVSTRQGNRWIATHGTGQVEFTTRSEFNSFIHNCRNRGALVRELSETDFFATQHSEDFKDEVYEEALRELLQRWTHLAQGALNATGIPIYQIPGNDEPLFCDEFFRSLPFIPVDQRQVAIADNLAVVGLGGSNPTPWRTPREYCENEIDNLIRSALESPQFDKPLIFFMHVPPWRSGIDEAPKLNKDLSYDLILGSSTREPIGSRAVRRAVEEVQPLLGLFGHAHESRGYVKIGTTLCINPGSAFEDGRLQGCIVTIKDGKIVNFQLTEG
jgi:Icc-related predicted phosphoesterase